MSTREKLYRKFGPQILEALADIIKDEINILRTHAGLSERTTAQLVNAIDTRLSQLSNYEWENSNET